MRVTWDTGPRPYSQGVSQGMMYPDDGPGVAWNGLISVTETSDQTQDPKYFDGSRYLTRSPTLPFAGIISAFTYPDELEDYIGLKDFFTGQPTRLFDMVYSTNNELHLVYGVRLAPSQHPYSTISDKVDPVAFQWNFTTLPQKIPGGKSTAHIVILPDDVPADIMAGFENMIYGDDEDDPHMPSIAEIIAMYEFAATLLVTDNEDGTFTVTSADDGIVSPTTSGHFTINAPTLAMIDAVTYTVSTY